MKTLPVTQSVIALFVAACLAIAIHGEAAGRDCASEDKCKALELHNQVRADLNAGRLPNSPRPRPPVAPLQYDEALARTARNWSAAQCNARLRHNPKRHAQFLANGGSPAYPSVGENIFYHSALLPEEEALVQAVASWAAEARQYRYGPFRDLKTGHYSQLIWNTQDAFDANGNRLPRAVGCGVYHCPSGKFRTIVTCNYAPAGNIRGYPPYRID
ncbi:CAP domain-containing protein [Microbulbifer thermotolerans]|uniref:CAP domain-containing protein n=1 Tax=Microbulbifer thermotolerans TaxID=252514 RepID=UPI00224879AF|nr:CAP domain-containing protein [Microbulbifer thermotolerans]MCX2831774.1 CAP domain-containing protein [Microbulbifer thermotolerans]